MKYVNTLESLMENGLSKDNALMYLLKRDISVSIGLNKDKEFYSHYDLKGNTELVTWKGRRYKMTLELINDNATRENLREDLIKYM